MARPRARAGRLTSTLAEGGGQTLAVLFALTDNQWDAILGTWLFLALVVFVFATVYHLVRGIYRATRRFMHHETTADQTLNEMYGVYGTEALRRHHLDKTDRP